MEEKNFFPLWLRNRLISAAGLEPVLSNTKRNQVRQRITDTLPRKPGF